MLMELKDSMSKAPSILEDQDLPLFLSSAFLKQLKVVEWSADLHHKFNIVLVIENLLTYSLTVLLKEARILKYFAQDPNAICSCLLINLFLSICKRLTSIILPLLETEICFNEEGLNIVLLVLIDCVLKVFQSFIYPFETVLHVFLMDF